MAPDVGTPTLLLLLLASFRVAAGQDNIALGRKVQKGANWQSEASVTDGRVDTCPRFGSTNYRLTLDQNSAFSWIRIVGNSAFSQVRVQISDCPSTASTVVSGNVQDWLCPAGVTASYVDFASNAAVVICEVLVAKVSFANVALGKVASQSSTFDGTDQYARPPLTFKAAAGLAVDGAPTKSYTDKTCAITFWRNAQPYTLDPWWQVDLGSPHDVIRVDIYGRDSANYNRLSVLVGNQPISVREEPKAFLRGAVSLPVRASSVRISLSGNTILQLCEVEVFAVRACPGNTFGENCDRSCSASCLNGECITFSGDCLQGCVAGYTGADCTSDVDECASSPCRNSGSCVNTPGSFSCSCSPGYTGELCQTEIDECASSPCQNGGVCNDHVNYFTCSCPRGFTGARCGTDIDECVSSPCRHQSTCENLPGSFRCKCIPGYTGQFCENDINECESYPCRNGATCQNQVNRYTCQCWGGYTGVNCETDIDECESGPCQNNATCRNRINEYTCRCVLGFTGTQCETNIDDCARNPCTYGTCQDGVNAFTCLCQAGFQGSTCSQECGNWTFGESCRERCGDACRGQCHVVTGNCSEGCHVGWTGTSCRDACSGGTFGEGCAKRCSANCLEHGSRGQHCHHSSGHCLNAAGCKPGFQGPSCSDKIANSTAIISAAVGVCILLCIGFAILGFVLYRSRQRKRRDGSRNGDNAVIDNGTGKGKGLLAMAPSCEVLYNNTTPQSATRITVAQLPEKVAAAKTDPDLFKEEFQSLPKGMQHPHSVAAKEENKGKNRYKNICAYDHSRVELSLLPDQPHSDYINACYVDGYKKPKAFIASQGPTDVNVADFVRMIWEKNVQNVAMVTMPTEEGKMKCVQYWSDTEDKKFGNLTVKVESTTVKQHFTFRILQIKPTRGPAKRVTHFLYTAWPDKDVPESPWSLIDFRDKVMTSANKRTSPILVHCSAGVGRTGTLIALDILLRQLAEEEAMDVYNTVWSLRQNRVDMVQTQAQYTFLHEAALVGLCSGSRVVAAEIFTSDPVANIKAKIIEEFKALQQCTNLLVHEECSLAEMNENRSANRDPQILPPDRYVAWLNVEWESYSNYLNAIVITNYEGRKRFILTQTPLPDTTANFWRAVLEYKVKAIVTLDRTQPDAKANIGEYVPAEEKSLQLGPLTLTARQAERSQGYTVRSIDIAVDDDKPESVHHFMVNCWPESEGVPPDPGAMVSLARAVLGKAALEEQSILVHCRDGARRSGLLCALLALLERCDADREVAVPYVVGVLQTMRPQTVHTQEQYAFLYAAMYQHVEATQVYENFPRSAQETSAAAAAAAENVYGNAEMLRE